MTDLNFVFSSFMDLGIVGSALFGFIITLILLRMVKYRRYKLPPGPQAYPFIGNLFDLRGKESHRLFAEWSKQYGPVISVYFGSKLTIILNNSKVAHEALTKKQGDFDGRHRTFGVDKLTDGGRDIVFGQGPTWRLMKKLALKGIRKFMGGVALEKKIHANMKMVEEKLKEKSEALDPTECVLNLITNLNSGVCFGKSYDFEDDDFKKLCEAGGSLGSLDNGLFREDIVPFLKYCPTKRLKRIMHCMEYMFNMIKIEIAKHRATLNPDDIRDLTDALLIAQAEEECEGTKEAIITDRHLVQALTDAFAAGIDTTKLALTFALKYMAAYPEVQKKLQDQIERVVGSDTYPRISHKENLSYTDAVIHEVLRIHPVSPFTVPHETICDTTVGGYDVPKGARMFVNFWALHHDSEEWDHVDEFRPERFLDDNGKIAPKPKCWLPFGAGKRSCLGEAVVKPEMVLILASFMQRFNVRFPEGEKPDMADQRGFIFLHPKPFKLIFEER